MKLSWGLVLSSLYCAASASSESINGHVYVYDPSVKSNDTPQKPITPETARLILAQRLGLSRYHSVKSVNEENVQLLRQYGGRGQLLFGQDRDSNQAHALIWLDGVENPQNLVDHKSRSEYSHFAFSNPPSWSQNQALVNDFLTQARSLPKRPDPQLISYESDTTIYDIFLGLDQENHISTYYSNLENAGKQALYRETLSTLLSAAKKSGFPLTIVITPPSTSKFVNHPYGTYTVPVHRLAPRRQAPEAILSSPAAPASSTSSNNSLEASEQNTTPLAKQGPLLGILKTCYESQSACEAATRNCSSHGACYLSRHGREATGGKGKTNDCYSCGCKPTIIKAGEGNGSNKTTNWGGPACQKKDVVIEFWLFAGSTVLLMFLIGSGVGMLYSMGEEELPSVIGAGVSGPTRK